MTKFIINIARVSLSFFMTAVLVTFALFTLLVTWDHRVPLMVAHYLWAPFMIFCTGSKLKVQGLNDLDLSKPHVFMMNHQSTLDIPVIIQAIPTPLRFVLKEELRWVPFVGQYAIAMGMILVDRSKRDKAIKSLKRAGEVIRQGASIIAYPEGTRSADGTILPFKKGTFVVAIEAGVPIVPVAVEGSRYAMPKDELNLSAQNIRVFVGDPIETKSYTRETMPLLMDKVRDAVIDLHVQIGGVGGVKSDASQKLKVQSIKVA